MPDTNETQSKQVVWHKALQHEELSEGRVKTVTVGLETLCLTHHEGQYAALDNRCPLAVLLSMSIGGPARWDRAGRSTPRQLPPCWAV